MAEYEVRDGVGIILEGTMRVECYAFWKNAELKSVVIPSSVTEIAEGAFSGCTALERVELPRALRVIGQMVFLHCRALTEIVLPDSLQVIDDNAFCGCTGLTHIEIPDAVSVIGDEAFCNCSGLTEFCLPGSVRRVGVWPLGGYTELARLRVAPDNRVYDSRGDCNAIIETHTDVLIQGCATTVIPDTVRVIAENAFSHCHTLTRIEIPASMEEIESGAFWDCTGLERVVVRSAATRIAGDAFCDCSEGLIVEVNPS